MKWVKQGVYSSYGESQRVAHKLARLGFKQGVHYKIKRCGHNLSKFMVKVRADVWEEMHRGKRRREKTGDSDQATDLH